MNELSQKTIEPGRVSILSPERALGSIGERRARAGGIAREKTHRPDNDQSLFRRR